MISQWVLVIQLLRSICILIVAMHLPGISSSASGQDLARDPVLLRLHNARCTTKVETINGVEAVVALRYDAHQSPSYTSTEELEEILESIPELRELSLLNLYSGQDTLRHLKNLKQLRSLDLSMSQIPAESLKNLEHLPHLETLKLNYCFGLDDEDAMQYVSALPNLKQLELEGYLLSDRWPGKEAWLKTVEEFFTLRQKGVYLSPKSVCSATQKTCAGLPMLVRLKQLQHLKLSASSIDDQGLEYLLQLPNLTHLDLSFTSISDDGMIAIGKLSKLRSLRLLDCLISDQGLQSIGKLVDLEELWLRGAWVTDQGLEHLRGCRSLKRINLANTLVTDESLQLLKSFPDLERLQAGESKITLRGMFNLSAANPKFTLRSAIAGFGIGTGTERRPSDEKQDPLSTLTELYMASNPRVNDDTLGALHEQGFLSDLSHLDLSDTSVTDEGMVYLRDSTQLHFLDIERTSVTDEGLNWLKNLKKLRYLPCRESQLTLPGMIHLIETLQDRPSEDVFTTACLTRDTGHHLFPTALDLHGMRISDDDLRLIVPSIELDTINLSDNPLSDAGVRHIAKIPQLRQLWISGPRISGEGLARLQDCRSLKTLWLTDTRATEDDLPVLANMKQLRTLNLSGMTFTKKGIEQLQALSHLETLIVDSTALTPNEVHVLQGNNPELVIILSQKRALAAVRDRERTDLVLPDGQDRVVEVAGVDTKVIDHPLLRTFGDTHFEQADRLNCGPNRESSSKDWKGLTTLRYVFLSGLKHPSDAITALKDLPVLEEIHLNRCTVADSDFKDMGILPSVKKLDLYDNIIRNTSLEYLSQLPNLESLGLYGYDVRISEAGIQNLSLAKSLTTLDLSRTTITDAAMAQFPCLQQLESLSLREVPIDSGSTHLTRLPNLKTLDLCNTLVTDETLDSFQPNKALRAIELAGTLVSESGVQRLQERMPDTQISGGRISEQARVKARLFGRLRIPMFRDHNDEVFMLDFRLREHLLETLPTVLQLKSLQQLRIGREATDEVLKQVAEISSLETINLWKSQVTENGLRSLLALPKLKNLYIVQTELSAKARSCLGEFTRLEGLSLIDTMVSDEDLSILRAMPHLQYLYLDGTQVTKDGLKYIDELAELSTLSVKRSKIARVDLKEFEERHPTCQVIAED
jgi:Leucine-rich repeat (LRR) protein